VKFPTGGLNPRAEKGFVEIQKQQKKMG